MIIDRIISRIKQMMQINEYKKVVGENITMTDTMIHYIDRWNEMLNRSAYWNGSAPSIGIPGGICREFADITINEMTATVDDEKLNEALQTTLRDLNENLQDGLALGSFIIKPYILGGKIGVEYITADKFAPIAFDGNGKLTDVLFVETRRIKENSYYHRTERHTLAADGLRIQNKAYKSSDSTRLGFEISLTDVEGWGQYTPDILYPIDSMVFGCFKTPLKNRIDGSGCGVSIYHTATELIKKADIQAARIDWEFESGERAVHVDERALKHSDGKTYMPHLNKRLYRGLDLEMGSGELLKEYSPTLRQDGFIQGLESYLRQIEFSVGLAYGDLSNVNEVEKTAEEIRNAKQRKYNRVTAIQENLRECLEDFVKALAFYMEKYNTKYVFTCSFDDSILTDEKSDREQDRADVALGVMSLAEYRSKWYGEDEETAKNRLPETVNIDELS